MKDAIPAQEEFRGLLEAFPTLSAIVEERLTTVAQVAVFRPASGGDGGGAAEFGGAGEEGSRVRWVLSYSLDGSMSFSGGATCVRT